MRKIGRNDPCPCGSGKKYKRCCMAEDRKRERQDRAHAGAAARALAWLYDQYPEEVARWIDEEYTGALDDEEAGKIAQIRSRDPEFSQFFEQNLNEFLLADGRLRIGRRKIRVADLVLGPGGPLFSVEQAEHLRQLGELPLRLYEVTEVVPGKGFRARDMLRRKAANPVFVQERAGSRQLRVWDTLGLRLMEIGGHLELSGAIYPLPREYASWMREETGRRRMPSERYARKREIGHWIVDLWLQSIAEQAEPPRLMDAASGGPMLFVTEHYRVLDWDALMERLARQPDVEADEDGWHRVQPLKENAFRSLVAIGREGKDRLTLFTKSREAADAQKQWFEQVAGASVSFLCRECVDPVAALTGRESVGPLAERVPVSEEAKIIREVKQRHYENWINEKLPALDGLSPREAIRTDEGRRKVVDLLKSMENREASLDDSFDFSFIWRALGLERG